jgi:uncharacterized protein (TIGR01619 family)
MKIVFVLTACLCLFLPESKAQSTLENWDNYIISVNDHPVSIVVNLSLKDRAPIKERPFVLILRTKYGSSDVNGFPAQEIVVSMDSIEYALETSLKKDLGAIYAGRFTQRGLREFYFYTMDTIKYLSICANVMDKFRAFPWLCKALADKTWSNYFEVLYPSPVELEKIENRRIIDVLKKKGDNLKNPRKIEHLFYFKTTGGRQSFLKTMDLPGFTIEDMPVERTELGDYGFRLMLARPDIPDNVTMDKISIYFRELSAKNNGSYEGWQTFVLKN